MRKELLIGDPHATAEEIDDCNKLMVYVTSLAKQHACRVVLLGDQHHTHNVIRSEVMNFWNATFKRMRAEGVSVAALVGNHDYSGENLPIHAMVAYEHLVEIYDKPTLLGGVLYIPYYSDRKKFIEDANKHGGKGLVCHATFVGSHYENGAEAHDGVALDELPQEWVVSGHLHHPQSVSKATYIGAPRWRTLADANVSRAVHLATYEDDGRLVSLEPFSTDTICRQIKSMTDDPYHPVELPLQAGIDWRIAIKGPADWVERRKKELAGPGVRLQTIVTTKTAPTIKESDGISTAFSKYLSKYTPKHGTNPEVLRDLAKERLHV